eukprot:EG_transcript_46235
MPCLSVMRMLRAVHPTKHVLGRGCRFESGVAPHDAHLIQVSLWQKEARQLRGETEAAAVKVTVKIERLEKEISVRWEEQFRGQEEKAAAQSQAGTQLQTLQSELGEEEALGQRMAADVQGLRSALQAALDEAA